MLETNLLTDIGFAPWTPQHRSATNISSAACQVINAVAQAEIHQDMDAQSNLDSMYFSGKALGKFATLIYVVHDLSQQQHLAAEGLKRLKAAFPRFVANQQRYPLVYDTAWKGIVSVGSYVTGDAGQDFGNTYYNDHHFHYSMYSHVHTHNIGFSTRPLYTTNLQTLAYFIHAAAIIATLDRSWIEGVNEANRDWVNTLVRDAASPTAANVDGYFPFSRSFDWYHGHSFAKGLYESADVKDQESSSEDAFFSYALKMWGHAIGDNAIETGQPHACDSGPHPPPLFCNGVG